MIDKSALKATLLTLEHEDLANAQQAYDTYVAAVFYDREQAVEDDDIAQASTQRNLAEEADKRVHAHEAHVARIEALSFGPSSVVEAGAVVKLAGSRRYLVVSTPTSAFMCQGHPFIGISEEAPLFDAMRGLSAGDTFELNGREMTIDTVA